MIDNFAIGLTHLLMAIAAWRLLSRADLDTDSASEAGADALPPDSLSGSGRTGQARRSRRA
jgi:hypothetical protein